MQQVTKRAVDHELWAQQTTERAACDSSSNGWHMKVKISQNKQWKVT